MFRSDVFPVAWLTTAASGGCKPKSAAAVDAEDVPRAHHAEESSRLKSANAVQCVCSTPMAMRLTEPNGNGGA